MDRETIIRMAGAAAKELYPDLPIGKPDENLVKMLSRFTELVAAHEREACAKVAENGNFLHDDAPDARFGKACAEAIRRRGDV